MQIGKAFEVHMTNKISREEMSHGSQWMPKKIDSRVNYQVFSKPDMELMLRRAKQVILINDAHRVEGRITWIEQVPVKIAMLEEKPNLS